MKWLAAVCPALAVVALLGAILIDPESADLLALLILLMLMEHPFLLVAPVIGMCADAYDWKEKSAKESVSFELVYYTNLGLTLSIIAMLVILKLNDFPILKLNNFPF